jgi:VWFA-related protein
MPPRRTACVVLLILAALPLTAQQPLTSPVAVQSQVPAGAPPPVPTLRTTLRQVVLDVVVNDKNGHAVKGLKASDFQLTEDGTPQTLVNFAEQVASTTTLPPNTFINHAPITGSGAITVILFDELSFADTAYVRYEVSNFIKTLTPGMPICVFKLDWRGLHLVQDFTTDPRTLREAVNSKRNDATMFRPHGYWQPNLLGDAMNELARYLSGFSGRKNLIWFTDGLRLSSASDVPTDSSPTLPLSSTIPPAPSTCSR